jgi:hypothetical protein
MCNKKFFTFIGLLLGCFIPALFAQLPSWEPPQNLSSSQTGGPIQPHVAAGGNHVAVVWNSGFGIVSVAYEIFAKVSMNAGASFTDFINLTGTPAFESRPRVAFSFTPCPSPFACIPTNGEPVPTFAVVWDSPVQVGGTTMRSSFFRYMTTGGSSVGLIPIQGIGASGPFSNLGPNVAMSGGAVYTAYHTSSNLVHFRRSLAPDENFYARWEPPFLTTPGITLGEGGQPNGIAATGSTVFVIWSEASEIARLRRSTDHGATWFPPLGSEAESVFNGVINPTITASGNIVVMAATKTGNGSVVYRRSTDGGVTFGNSITINSSPPVLAPIDVVPRLAVEGNAVAIVFQTIGAGNTLKVRAFLALDGTNFQELPSPASTPIVTGGFANLEPDIAMSSGRIYVVWREGPNNNSHIGFCRSTSIISSVQELTGELPVSFELGQNYPNPFNPITTIAFALPRSSHAMLKVFDILGKEVATLVDQELATGRYKVRWDASGFESGVYFYRLQAGEFVQTKKLVLLK